MAASAPTILVADDHPLFREALKGAVSRLMPGAQGFSALVHLRALQPQLPAQQAVS